VALEDFGVTGGSGSLGGCLFSILPPGGGVGAIGLDE